MSENEIKKESKIENAAAHEISDDNLDNVAGGGVVDWVKESIGGLFYGGKDSKPKKQKEPKAPTPAAPPWTPEKCPICGQTSSAWIFIHDAPDGTKMIYCDDCGYEGPLYLN